MIYDKDTGGSALYDNTTGYNNTATGYRTLFNNEAGYENTATGCQSLYSSTTGYSNAALGFKALYSLTTGDKNTGLGVGAGSNITTGRNLTLVGYNAQPSAADALNQVTLGDNYVNSLRCNVQSISSLSDVRDKKNITDLPFGLDFIMKVKPRQFNWDRRDWYENNQADGSRMQETPTAGFIAQELDEVQMDAGAEWLKLVLKDNPDKWEATPGNLMPVMIKAMQELKAENDRLKEENEKIKANGLQVENRLEKLEYMISVYAEKK